MLLFNLFDVLARSGAQSTRLLWEECLDKFLLLVCFSLKNRVKCENLITVTIQVFLLLLAILIVFFLLF